ncbi:MAG: stress responsive alpha-beta barrel protein [Glaciihabitans sp.]|nr:stress responsive alpha-beta barrel protein [Glaciihabitans sp.]
MIRHIVTWKLTATDETAKAEAYNAIADALGELVGVIPEIEALTVSRNVAFEDVNWDLVLVADYESIEALQAYQVHPQHVAAAAIVRSHVSERASIDFEL